MDHEVSLPCSQEPTAGPFPDLDDSYKIWFNIILSS
jgi:hypothetical protein